MTDVFPCACGTPVVVGNVATKWPHELFLLFDAEPVPTEHGFARIGEPRAVVAPRFVRTTRTPAFVPHVCRRR